MSSKILSRADIDFMLYEWLDVERLTARPRFAEHSRETFSAVLDLCEKVATDKFANHSRKADLNECHIDNGQVQMVPEVEEGLKAFAEAGLLAASQDYELGGMQLPTVVDKAGFAWFLGANTATASFPLLTMGNSNLLVAYGTSEMVERYVKPMLEGRFFGTMCLSEPQSGSSLAGIRTRAIAQEDGSYRLFGNKMWISAGEHEVGDNIVHLVLARLPDAPAGVKGISLFLVPRYLLDSEGNPAAKNDVALAGLNHKMGVRGSPNCLMNFGEGAHKPDGQSGAVGWLVGELNQGLSAMFHMMNEARIAVGITAAALAYTAYLHSLDYAKNRPQGYIAGESDSKDGQVNIIRHADVKRMLLIQKAYAEGALALNLYCAWLIDEHETSPNPEDRERARLLLELLTPIAKSWSSQWSLEGCSWAIQIHGGSGFTRDFSVEQFYRDNRINPIHEGTHGIHGLDLLGRKVSMEGGAAFSALISTVNQTIGRAAADPALSTYADALNARLAKLCEVTATLTGLDNRRLTLANSSAYLESVGHIVVSWLWLEQMLAADGDSDLHKGKRHAGKYFFRWELPRVDSWLNSVGDCDTTTLEMQDEWF